MGTSPACQEGQLEGKEHVPGVQTLGGQAGFGLVPPGGEGQAPGEVGPGSRMPSHLVLPTSHTGLTRSCS